MYPVIDRLVSVNYSTAPNRPIVGLVLHDTESGGPLTVAQSLGSWHWLIDRDGTCYSDVSEQNIAWHVRACDRWRPQWMIAAPKQQFSDANYSCLGIELVSNLAYRQAGVPFTDDQYASLKDLLHNLFQRYGSLPTVGHGQLQLDRSDPVDFDWTRAGFGPFEGGWGYRWQESAPSTAIPLPTSGPTLEEALEALRLANLQKHEFEFYIVDLDHRKSVDEDAMSKGITPQQDMLAWAQSHFDAGETAP